MKKGNVWIYKYRHQTQRDSVALFVYAPTHNGSKYPKYGLNIGNSSGKPLVVSLDDKSKTGKMASVQTANGKLFLDVDEVPKLVLYSEK